MVVVDEAAARQWAATQEPGALRTCIVIDDYGQYQKAFTALCDAGLIGDDAVRIDLPSLQKSVLNERFKQGEIPDGCNVAPEGEAFSIR